MSAWIAEAIEHKLRTRDLAALVAEWEAESGQPVTEEELARAKAFWQGTDPDDLRVLAASMPGMVPILDLRQL